MSDCACFPRRQFSLVLGGAMLARAAEDPEPWSGPADVRKVYLGAPQPTWPRPDLDVKQE